MPQTGPPFSVSRPRPWQASAGFAHEMVVPPHSTHGVGSMLVFAQNSQRHEMRKSWTQPAPRLMDQAMSA